MIDFKQEMINKIRNANAPELTETPENFIQPEPPLNFGDTSDNCFETMSWSNWLDKASTIKNPTLLWKELQIEGETACLFSDTNTGKSVLAVQIARDIALKGYNVLYFDFELSAKQIEKRYVDENTGMRVHFPNNMFRAEMHVDETTLLDLEGCILPKIKEEAFKCNCQVLIIDNLTWITSTAEYGEAASLLMKELLTLKKEYGMTILVLAHTPKRDPGTEISQNDLAGSKQLINFFDSAFAIGKSTKEESLRYIKQIKARSTPIVYGRDNVMVCELLKENGFLHFEELGYDSESIHLAKQKSKDKVQQVRDAVALHTAGKSIREIAAELGISKSKAAYIIKNHTSVSA